MPSTASNTASRHAGFTEFEGVSAVRATLTEIPDTMAPCSLINLSASVKAFGFDSTSDLGINRPPRFASVMLLKGLNAL